MTDLQQFQAFFERMGVPYTLHEALQHSSLGKIPVTHFLQVGQVSYVFAGDGSYAGFNSAGITFPRETPGGYVEPQL